MHQKEREKTNRDYDCFETLPFCIETYKIRSKEKQEIIF